MIKRIHTPVDKAEIANLRAGDKVLLSGVVYTARDAAHKRIMELLDQDRQLPVDLAGAAIYYAGPCPAPPGRPIGSAGPTTSGRMDSYTPRLLRKGLAVMIGKGQRSGEVIEVMKQAGAVYLAATGGAGALIAQRVQSAKVVAFEDLGTEAIRELVVEDFPLIVAIDAQGNDLYKLGPKQFARTE